MMEILMLQSDRLILRPARAEDISFVLEAERDPDNAPFISPWPEEKHRKALDSSDTRHFILEKMANGHPIGFAIFSGMDQKEVSLCLTRIVVTEKGNGYGREALQLCKRYAFDVIGTHRFWLDVKLHNERAYQLYLKEGFVEEGVLRDVLKEGDTYTSLRVMSMLEHEYRGGSVL
jgi:diamine N-acetyltransferase